MPNKNSCKFGEKRNPDFNSENYDFNTENVLIIYFFCHLNDGVFMPLCNSVTHKQQRNHKNIPHTTVMVPLTACKLCNFTDMQRVLRQYISFTPVQDLLKGQTK